MNSKKTSTSIASLAANKLADNGSSATAKKLAASALAQAHSNRQTGAEMEAVASAVMRSNKYSTDTKKLAASILSQSNVDR